MKKVTKNKTFLFFILGLTILILAMSSTVMATDFYITDDDEVQTASSTSFSANSDIGHLLEGTYYVDKTAASALWALGKRPELVKIYLKNPAGETKYKIDAESGPYGFTDEYFAIQLKDVDLRIPANSFGFSSPDMGAWRVEVTWYSEGWLSDNHFAGVTSSYIVGESDLMDNLMAPNYIYMDMFGVFASGDEISIALPGIFFLSMLIWVPAVSIGLLMYIKSSYKIGMHLFKRESGGKKNVKKTNK